MKPWEFACTMCAGLTEVCVHLAQLKLGIVIPHPEGISSLAANYLAVRR